MKGSLENGLAVLVGKWAIGASGAVGAKTRGQGMSLSRTAAGSYTLQLTGVNGVSARVASIVHVSPKVVTSDTDPSNDAAAIDARTLSQTDSTGVILLQTFDEAGAVQDPASGAFLTVAVFVCTSASTR